MILYNKIQRREYKMEDKKELIKWIEVLLNDAKNNMLASDKDNNMYHYFSGQATAYESILFGLKLEG